MLIDDATKRDRIACPKTVDIPARSSRHVPIIEVRTESVPDGLGGRNALVCRVSDGWAEDLTSLY